MNPAAYPAAIFWALEIANSAFFLVLRIDGAYAKGHHGVQDQWLPLRPREHH